MTSNVSKFKYFSKFSALSMIFDTLELSSIDEEVKKINALLEENSDLNKRAHIEFILQLTQ